MTFPAVQGASPSQRLVYTIGKRMEGMSRCELLKTCSSDFQRNEPTCLPSGSQDSSVSLRWTKLDKDPEEPKIPYLCSETDENTSKCKASR